MRKAGLITGADRDDSFMGKGICSGEDPEIWSPVPDGDSWQNSRQVDVAKSICAECPVRADCLAYATAGHEFGTWGGEYLINGKIAQRSGRRPGPATKEAAA